MPSSPLPRVHIIVLGGTITMIPTHQSGIVPALSGEDLVGAVPGLAAIARITVETPFLVPGASLSFEQIRDVSELSNQSIARGADGVVIVQGTDTIDETAFLLDLAHTGDAPLVVTGAMRGAQAVGADGPANLFAAITTAASPSARGLGALVVLNDEIHGARFVEKSHKSLPSAFSSPSLTPLGVVAEGEVKMGLHPRRPLLLGPMPKLGRVALIKLCLGDDGEMIEAALERDYDGMVIEAMGAGHVPAATLPALDRAVACMPVILSSRATGGSIFRQTYGFAGAERDLLARGLIPASTLSATKARLLLAFLLGQGRTGVAIAASFQQFQ